MHSRILTLSALNMTLWLLTPPAVCNADESSENSPSTATTVTSELEHLRSLVAARDLEIVGLKGEVARSNAVAAEQVKQLHAANSQLAVANKELAELRQKSQHTEMSLRGTIQNQEAAIGHLEAKLTDMRVQHARSEQIMELIRQHVPTSNGLPELQVLLQKLTNGAPASSTASKTTDGMNPTNHVAWVVVRMPADPALVVSVEGVPIVMPSTEIADRYQLVRIRLGEQSQRRAVIHVAGFDHQLPVRSGQVVGFDADHRATFAILR